MFDPPEQSERAEPLLALDARRVAERLAGLQQQLALDRRGARPLVADDDHVVDDDLRPLGDREEDVRARVAVGEHHARIDRRRSRSRDCGTRGRCGRGRTRRRPPSTPCRARSPATRGAVRGREHHVAAEIDGADDRARPFGDGDRDLHVAIVGRRRPIAGGEHRHRRHHHRAREAARAVQARGCPRRRRRASPARTDRRPSAGRSAQLRRRRARCCR